MSSAYGMINQSPQKSSPALNSTFFGSVMMWLALSFVASGAGIFLLGPMLPSGVLFGLSILVLVSMLIASFTRAFQNPVFARIFAIAVPLALSASAYPLLNSYVASGAGNLIVIAAVGALVIFGGMAVWGWTTKRDILGWGAPLFFITLGLVAMSITNLFLNIGWLSTIISMAVLVVFSIWTMYDIQSIKHAEKYGTTTHPAVYALNLWLDIWNIFLSLLRLLRS